VFDIGTFGQSLAQFLYTLKNSEHHKHFAAVRRTLKAVIPSVQDFQVDLNRARGTLDLEIVQNKIPFSVRMASEGTLRVLALIAIAVNPWPSSVIAFEEPENGVHLRRLELIAELLSALALERDRQVIVTTHSPHFCEQILKIQKRNPGKVGLFVVQQEGGQTNCKPFLPTGPLFERREISEKLVVPAEDGWFQGMVLRGLVDA
jgi:predicted ATPase